MNDFDRYLLEDLVGIYDQGPEADDWEELYHRFENLSYLPETLPYLLTMRYFGWGTQAQPEQVLAELESLEGKGNHQLDGLNCDLRLISNPGDASQLEALKIHMDGGYTERYLKDRSHVYWLGALPVRAEYDEGLKKLLQSANQQGCAKVRVVRSTEERLVVEAAQCIHRGFVSPYLAENQLLSWSEYQAPRVLLFAGMLEDLQSLLPLLEQQVKSDRPLIIFAESFGEDVLSTLLVNVIRGTIRISAVEGVDPEELQRLTQVTGGTLYKRELELKSLSLESLPTVERMVLFPDRCYIFSTGKFGTAPDDMEKMATILVTDEACLERYEKALCSPALPDPTILAQIEQCDPYCVAVEKGKRVVSATEFVPSLVVNNGCPSKRMVKDEKEGLCLTDVRVAILTEPVESIQDLLPLLEQFVSNGWTLLLMGPDFSQEVISTLEVNAERGSLRCGFVQAENTVILTELSRLLSTPALNLAEIHSSSAYDFPFLKWAFLWRDRCILMPKYDEFEKESDLLGLCEDVFYLLVGGNSVSEQNKLYDYYIQKAF